jgi:serine/threonine protein kinase
MAGESPGISGPAGAVTLVGGRYRLDGVLGRGGFGVVHRATDDLLHRVVAVKEVRLPISESGRERDRARERVLREARAAGRLHHPGAVTVLDVIDDGDLPWIVMEFVEGRSLSRIIADEGPRPVDETCRIGISIAYALEAAHRLGVVHRDVKPSNVLVTPDGRARLTDFGIAVSHGDPRLTSTGMVLGSPAYLPPERARGDTGSAAGDRWGLGAALFTTVEGTPPFAGENAIAVLAALMRGQRQPFRFAGPLAPLIDDLMAPRAAERPSLSTVRRRLREILAQMGARRAARTGGRATRPSGPGTATTGPHPAAGAAGPPAESPFPMPGPPPVGSGAGSSPQPAPDDLPTQSATASERTLNINTPESLDNPIAALSGELPGDAVESESHSSDHTGPNTTQRPTDSLPDRAPDSDPPTPSTASAADPTSALSDPIPETTETTHTNSTDPPDANTPEDGGGPSDRTAAPSTSTPGPGLVEATIVGAAAAIATVATATLRPTTTPGGEPPTTTTPAPAPATSAAPTPAAASGRSRLTGPRERPRATDRTRALGGIPARARLINRVGAAIHPASHAAAAPTPAADPAAGQALPPTPSAGAAISAHAGPAATPAPSPPAEPASAPATAIPAPAPLTTAAPTAGTPTSALPHTAPETTDEAGADPADTAPHEGGPRHSRAAVAAVALGVLATLAIVAVLVLISTSGSSSGHSASGATATLPALADPAEANRPPGSRPTAAASGASVPLRSADPEAGQAAPIARDTRPAVAPAGWVSYTDPDAGWSVSYPAAWQRQAGPGGAGNVDFVDPATRSFLRVGSVRQANTSALGDWQRNEAGFVRSVQDYRRVRLAPSDGGDGAGQADWEFTYRRSDGVMVHVLNRGAILNGHGYALYWHTRDDLWLRDQPLMRELFGTFRPGP